MLAGCCVDETQDEEGYEEYDEEEREAEAGEGKGDRRRHAHDVLVSAPRVGYLEPYSYADTGVDENAGV